MDQFCVAFKLTMVAERTDRNPSFMDDQWEREANHWRLAIYCGVSGRTFETFFSQGSGVKHEPLLPEVLECLRMDVGAMGRSFEEWCGDCGYDTDSRRAEGIYKACVKTAWALEHLLGEIGFVALLDVDL